MGRVDPALVRDWDHLAASLGKTPKLDSTGEIIPIGAPGKKDKIYVVWVGRAIGLFKNWGLTGAMVLAFPGGIHKSFRSLEAAREAWHTGPSKLPNWTPPAPRPALVTPTASKEAHPANSTDDGAYARTIPLLTPPPTIPLRLPADATEDALDEWLERLLSTPPESPSTSISRASSVSSAAVSAVAARPGERFSARPSELVPPSPAKHGQLPSMTPRRRAHSRGAAAALSPASTPSQSVARDKEGTRADIGRAREHVIVRPGGTVYAVVRGDRPGVYLDRSTALLKAGCNPGMKIVPFATRLQAAWYFVESYMEGEVGVPVVEYDEDEDEADEDEDVYYLCNSDEL